MLKLAKGDSFCSAEHFDAHQLKLSKDAFERLKSAPEEEAPKAPLMVKAHEAAVAAAPPPEGKAAFARLAAFEAPKAQLPRVEAPPYAPFASSSLSPCLLNPPSDIANGPESGLPVATLLELTFPVHDVAATVCILNLYLRLNLAAEPKNWVSPRYLDATPEHGSLKPAQPPLGFGTEFPRIDAGLEEPDQPVEVAAPPDLAPEPVEVVADEIVPPTEAATALSTDPVLLAEAVSLSRVEPVALPGTVSIVEAETIPSLTPILPTEPASLAPIEPVASVEAAAPEEFAPVVAEAAASALEPISPSDLVSLAPLELAAPVEAPAPEETAVVVAEAVALTLEPMSPSEPASPAPLELVASGEAGAREEIAPAVEAEPVEKRLPFLVAPSFLERTGKPILIHSAASSTPNDASLSPIRDGSALPRLDSCDAIPNSKRFADTKTFRAQNAEARWIGSASEVAVPPAFVLPEPRTQRCEKAWRPSNSQFPTPYPVLEASRVSTRAVEFALPKPASLMVHPDAAGLRKIDPQQMLSGASPLDTKSLFLGVLETRPLGKEPLFVKRAVCAMELGWNAALAEFPVWQALPPAWQPGSGYFSLPDPIAPGDKRPMLPLPSLQYAPACAKLERIENLRLPKPYVAQDWYRPTAWVQTDFASAPLPAEPGLAFVVEKLLPRVAAVPPGSLKTGPGRPELTWQPSLPAKNVPAAAKLLPARNGAILPTAKSWPRLGPVPR
ncbi:MAG TPA: hypothetical protein VK752_14225 [Bryobacteraceae bacterium]|nr:hypothetical protein [Bryobacteraceae bacterium]